MGTRFRFSILIAGAFTVYGALIFRLYDLQIAKGDTYAAKASSQFSAGETLDAPRGVIYFTDKNGNRTPVAVNRDFPVVYAVPKEIADVPTVTAKLLSLFPEGDAEALTRRMSNKKSAYVLFGKKVGSDVERAIRNLDLKGAFKGVYVESQPFRYYTLGKSAGHLLGFVGPSADSAGDRGRYGVEEYYDRQLTGEAGVLEEGKISFPRPGEDLDLTIDPNVQAQAQTLLTNLVSEYSAAGGTIIVQEPHSGKILGLVNAPVFDPNEYGKSDIASFANGATEKQYEPGSVIKVLTMAAGIDTGAFTAQTHVFDSGRLDINGHTIRNWDLKGYGDITMTNVIERSLNVGTAAAQRLLGNEKFIEYMTDFGFGEKTGIDLPGEISGNIDPILEKGAPEIAFATASFGQGIASTPIQVITAISAIANGGTLMRPYVNAALEPEEVRRVVKEDTARQVAQMMTTAVVTNKVADIPGYDVAAKTGTAQVALQGGGGYGDKVINSYVGFAPSFNPRFTILVKLDKPAGAPLAGQTVVPVFRELAQFLLTYFEVPPDRSVQPGSQE